jgi:hypothetical protein
LRPSRVQSMNQVQTCTGDPNVEANWHEAGMFSGGKATLSGLAPGTTLWVSVCTAGIRRHGRLEGPGEDHGGVRGAFHLVRA